MPGRATQVCSSTLHLAMIATERLLDVGIFDPELGGDPLLFQRLFCFYSHPAVYIMILPAMGVVSEVITCFARKPVFGYRFIVYSQLAIAAVGFMVWRHTCSFPLHHGRRGGHGLLRDAEVDQRRIGSTRPSPRRATRGGRSSGAGHLPLARRLRCLRVIRTAPRHEGTAGSSRPRSLVQQALTTGVEP